MKLEERFKGVITGFDIDMSKISSCRCKLSVCEKTCPEYSSCQNVAIANDEIADFEQFLDTVKEKIYRKKENVVVLDEEKELHITRNGDGITISRFDVMKNNSFWYSNNSFFAKEEQNIIYDICCNNLPLVYQFTENVLNHDRAFVINRNDRVSYFVQSSLDPYKGKMVYGQYGFYDEDSVILNDEQELKLVALVVSGVVYIINKYMLELWTCKDVFPESIKILSAKEFNERVGKEIFPMFYDALETKEVSENAVFQAKKEARKRIFTGELETAVFSETVFDIKDTIKILCGVLDFTDEALKRLEKDKDKWVMVKSHEKEVQEFISEPDIVANWELRMAKALRNINAKNVTVEFTYKGKSAACKMPINNILNKLNEKDFFHLYDFTLTREGEELFEYLGASRYANNPETNLYCENIAKITYSRKTLYEKEV